MKLLTFGISLLLPLMAADTMDEHNKRIHAAATVMDEIMGAPDKGIPSDLLEKAQCIGIVPGLKRAGFIVGGQYGKGVLTCRLDSGKWSPVSTVRIEGGSIGFQIGAGETDLVFIVMNKSGMEKLMKDKFTVGADASAMAGPVGRTAQAQTDALMRAEMLSYSRSRGVFGGVSLQGATLRPDNDDNAKIYGESVTQEQILHGHVKRPVAADELYTSLNKWAPYKNPPKPGA
jgi:SH3 domain-containing YSC84-like protein 1